MQIDFSFYSLAEIHALSEGGSPLSLSPEVVEQMARGEGLLRAKLAEGAPLYAVNTGWGALCETAIAEQDLEELQHRQIRSHACGVGPLVDERRCRLVVILKLLSLRWGHSGVSGALASRLVELFNLGMIPAIPQKGTVGASGDLAPLAHMALPLIGEGKVHWRGQLRPAAEALAEAGLAPLRLRAKEGIALVNGVQYINALAADCLRELDALARCADLVAALSLQAFSCADQLYHPRYHQASFHEERRLVAQNLAWLLEGSNHAQLSTCQRSRQDPYSFRCIPQVHGAVRQTLRHAVRVVEAECNQVSDNPLLFADEGLALCGGSLHGASTAFVLDFAAIAATELASVSERRSYQLLSGQRGLPGFLTPAPGLNSGLMVAQYTAAALVNESKVLSTPASVDTIPTCQLQEDSVSMGGTSAYKLRTVVDNCAQVLAIELLFAAQAVDLNPALRLSDRTKPVYEALRRSVAPLEHDRLLADDIAEAHRTLQAHLQAWAAPLR